MQPHRPAMPAPAPVQAWPRPLPASRSPAPAVLARSPARHDPARRRGNRPPARNRVPRPLAGPTRRGRGRRIPRRSAASAGSRAKSRSIARSALTRMSRSIRPRAMSAVLAWAPRARSSAARSATSAEASCLRKPSAMPIPIASMSMPCSIDCWNAATFSSSTLRCSAMARCARACSSPYTDNASVRGLDDLVLCDDGLVAEAHAPGRPSRLQLLGAELPLHPAIEVMDAVRMHADRRQNLPALGALGRVERDPALVVQPKRLVETGDVAGAAQPEVPLERQQELRAQVVGRLPKRDLEVVELLAKLEVAQHAVSIDGLLLAREPRCEPEGV